MSSTGVDAVGSTVHLLRGSDQEWVDGIVDDYHPDKGYHVQYFDGDDEWRDGIGKMGEKVKSEQSEKKKMNISFSSELEVITKNTGDPKTFDFQALIDQNRQLLTAKVGNIPENGVMVSGNILGISDLIPNDIDDGSNVSFRILFVEGRGNKAAMFRTKTPVYSSKVIPVITDHATWSDHSFRFEAEMPSDSNDPRDEITMQGDVMISLYRARNNGGNDLIGQKVFSLAETKDVGNYEYLTSGYEGRSLNGEYPVVTKSGKVVGTLHLVLFLAFKSSESPEPESPQIPLIRPNISVVEVKKSTPTKKPRASSASPASARNRMKEKKDLTSKDDGALGKKVTARSAMSKMLGVTGNKGKLSDKNDGTRKIASKFEMKQRADAMKQAAQNKKMKAWIEQNGARKKPTVEESKKKTIMEKVMNKEEKEKELVEKLLENMKNTRKSIALETEQNKALKSKLSKLKVSISNCETTINKLAKRNSGSHVLKKDDTTSIANVALKSSGANSVLNKFNASQTANSEAKAEINENFVQDFSDFFGEEIGQDQDAMKDDEEYKNLSTEFLHLQKTRRDILNRIREAKNKFKDDKLKKSKDGDQKRLIIRRLYLFDEVKNYYTLKTTNFGNESKSDHDFTPSEKEIVTYERLRSLNEDCMKEKLVEEELLHTATFDSALAELNSIADTLKKKIEIEEEEVKKLSENNEKVQKRLKILSDNDKIQRRKWFSSKISLKLLQTQGKQLLKFYADSHNDIDMQQLQLKLRLEKKKIK